MTKSSYGVMWFILRVPMFVAPTLGAAVGASVISQDPTNPTSFAAPIGIGTATPLAALDVALTGTGASAIIVPRDTTGNRPSTPVNGMIRYAANTSKLEAYVNGAWGTIPSGSNLAPESALAYGATLAINWLNGPQQTVTLTGNTAITFTNGAAGQSLRLIICQDATGSRTVTSWDASVVWTGGTAPVLTTAASKCDVTMFIGTNAKGSLKMFGSSALNF